MPALSIVTVVRNHKEGLKKTMDSVLSQTFKDYEYIVADGASDDGTLELINENQDVFSRILLGPDGGIYDAMNKGAAAAHGNYILFMNAGDVFSDNHALDTFFRYTPKADVVYGDYSVDYGYMERFVKAKPLNRIWQGMITSHQAIFVKTELMKENPFDCSVKIGADFDRIYGFYVDGKTFQYVPVTLAVTESGGLSDKKRITVYKNHIDTIKKYGIKPYMYAYYGYTFAHTALRLWLKKVLPEDMVKKITKLKVDR